MLPLPDVHRVAELLPALEKRLREPLSPRWAARNSCWSLAHFHRKFTAVAGESFLSYLRGRRLFLASMDLITGNRSIQSIAWDASFAHVPAFHKAFGRRYGRTPAEFRRVGLDQWTEARDYLDPAFLLHLHEGRIDSEPAYIEEPGRACLGLHAYGGWSEFEELFHRFREDLSALGARPGRILCFIRNSREDSLLRRLHVFAGIEAGALPQAPAHWAPFAVPARPVAEFRHHAGNYARTCFHIWRHWPLRHRIDEDKGHTVESAWDGTNPFTGRRALVLRVPLLPAAPEKSTPG